VVLDKIGLDALGLAEKANQCNMFYFLLDH
jgi:hypothetical protein